MTLPLSIDILIDDLFPLLDLQSLLRLARTSKEFHRLILTPDTQASELIWRRLIRRDLRFPVENTARTHGWLSLYRKVHRPNVYLWGEAKNARLALSRNDPRVKLLTRSGGIPVPARLQLDKPVVDLVAGGWSFHALTVDGRVIHWGQLNGNTFAPYRGGGGGNAYAHPGSVCQSPTIFQASVPPIQRLVSGRSHVLALDEDGRLWTWGNWAEAGQVRDTWLVEGRHRVQDFASGWNVSAVLVRDARTGEQEVRIWWQIFLSPRVATSTSQRPGVLALDGMPRCYTFRPQALRLPDLPDGERIVKIAAGDNFVVALTTSGKVYKIDVFPPPRLPPGIAEEDEEEEERNPNDDEDESLESRRFEALVHLCNSGRRVWEYLPNFSETHEAQEGSAKRLTYISASFRTFFAIGPGVVLQGHADTTAESSPIIRPELQNRDIIRVEVGDYHYGALTSSGQLLTWGQYSNGALGHGEANERIEDSHFGNMAVAVPQEVKFGDPLKDHLGKDDEFVFNVTMAGWASSALTVNFNEEPEDIVAEEEPESKDSGPAASPENDNETELMAGRGRGVFNPAMMPIRVGFAGRGRARGGRGTI